MRDLQPEPLQLELLTKPDCSLCDRTRAALERLAADYRLSVAEIDITEEPELWERYRYAIPVVRACGRVLLSGRIAEWELRQEIERALGPYPLGNIPEDEIRFLPLLQCPACRGELESRPRAVACLCCGREYRRRSGVLLLMEEPEDTSRPGFMDRVLQVISFRLPEDVGAEGGRTRRRE